MQPTLKSPTLTTEYGRIEGVLESGIAVFRNIPFAAAPIGANRFRPPVAPESWDGVRDASTSGPAAPQPRLDQMDPVDLAYFNPSVQGDDCLTLEVYTPDPGGAGLPVMVWIHGGGYMFGAGSAPGYRGRAFARDGIVHVALNYRLGVEGFLYLGEGNENLGLRDQVAALEWVQRNIAAFGGNPQNVTIFGQSGGAVSVMDLMAMPSARGLFVRAIAQSGSPVGTVPIDDAMVVTRRLAKRLGVSPTLDGFDSTTLDQTLAATPALALDFINPFKNGRQAFMISPFRAVHGTQTIPDPPLVAAAAGPGVPLLAGTNRNETVGFLKALGRVDRINPFIGWYFGRMLQVSRATRAAYRNGPRKLTNGFALVEAGWTDWAFRIPTIRLLEARSSGAPEVPSYLYEFRWDSPLFPPGLGAFHSIEQPFARDDIEGLLAIPGGDEWLGDAAPQELADAMHSSWVRFAQTGDPGWPQYEPRHRATKIFDRVVEVVDDAAAPERQTWEGRR